MAIIKKSLSAIPPNATAFYCSPLLKPKATQWFSCVPVGKNSLSSFMKKIAEKANWDRSKKWTNHSLRATAASRLLESGCSNSVIKATTGHKSDRGLDQYLNRSDTLKRTVSSTLAGAETKKPKQDVLTLSQQASSGKEKTYISFKLHQLYCEYFGVEINLHLFYF